MRRIILNTAFATMALLGASSIVPAKAHAMVFASCEEGGIIVRGTYCGVVDGHCVCSD